MNTERHTAACGLDRLAVEESATVIAIQTDPAMRRRLLDLGLTLGSTVSCVGRSPCKDPSAYLISGAVMAIRRRDAEQILVLRDRKGDCL